MQKLQHAVQPIACDSASGSLVLDRRVEPSRCREGVSVCESSKVEVGDDVDNDGDENIETMKMTTMPKMTKMIKMMKMTKMMKMMMEMMEMMMEMMEMMKMMVEMMEMMKMIIGGGSGTPPGN